MKGSVKLCLTVFLLGCAQALVYPVDALAQECVVVGGCGGDVPSGMCGTSTEPVETGTGCNGVKNCQDPEILSGPTIEVDPQPVTLFGTPLFNVRMSFEIKSPWNVWARENNPNGQLQARWLDSAGRVSSCHSNLADRSKVWVSKTMTCADMRSARGGGADTYSLVVASCGPPCNPDTEPQCLTHECHKWVEKKDVPFSVPDSDLEQYCPPKRCPPGTCCPGGPPGSGPPGLGFGGGGGWGVGGSSGPAGGQALSPTLKTGPNPTLGRFWSHTFAERIIPKADPGHAWLFTADAVYQEFWDVDGDGTFDKTSPTDVESTLRRVGSAWELRALNGTVKEFGADGQWTATRDRNGNLTAGTYSNGVLERVDMPDARSLAFTYHPDGLLASITEIGVDDITSRTWSYTWDGSDLSRIDRPDGTSWLFRYDDPVHPGYLTRRILRGTDGGERIVDARKYDAYGNVSRQWKGDESPTGPDATEVYSYSYPDPWNPTEKVETDPLGNLTTTSLRRDPDSNIPLVTSSSGECSSCGVGPDSRQYYDDPANPMKVIRSVDARGTVTLFEFDGNGQMISRTEAFMTDLERTTSWEYDDTYPSLVKSVERPSTSGSGVRRTSWTYDGAGNSTVQIEEGVENGSAFSYETVTVYNSAGQPESIDPPGGGTQDQTSFSYNLIRGNLIVETRTDPLIGTTSFGYDPLNRRTLVTDVNGVVFETTYDALDRAETQVLKGATPSEDQVTTTTYTPFGDLHRTIYLDGSVVEYGYDGAGRLISIENKPDLFTHGERTFYTLDAAGHRTLEERQTWDGEGWRTESWTGYEYSSSCQLGKVLHANGSVTERAYDCEGRLSLVWDANHPSNNQTNPPSRSLSYDILGRLKTITEPWGGAGGGTVVTRYEYDVQDHAIKIIDANATVTDSTYSDRDLVTKEISEVSGTTTYGYDERGYLTRQTDARGITVERVLDAAGRVTLVDYPDDSLDVHYVYDDPQVPFSKERLTAITRGDESIEYRYDRLGRLTQDGNLTYDYGLSGNRTVLGYPGGVTAYYTYDTSGRERTLSVQVGSEPLQPVVTSTTYQSTGALTSLTFGNGLQEIRQYTTLGYLEGIQVGSHMNWNYTTDSIGNVTAIQDASDPSSSRSFGYQDNQYYLTQGNGPWGSLQWTYDKIGNRLTENRDGVVMAYTYKKNAAMADSPQLTSTLSDGGTASSVQYYHDSAGGLTVRNGRVSKTRYRYNVDSRMSLIRGDSISGPIETTLEYDGRGFLAQSTLNFGADSVGAQTTRPTYSSNGVLHHRSTERRPTERSLRGTSMVTGDDYIFYFAGRPVAMLSMKWVEGGGASPTRSWAFLSTDNLGTPVLATADSGDVIWTGGLEPFGKDFSNANNVGLFLRLPGQWGDDTWQESSSEDGLHYNVHRWYDAGLGRFLRIDPVPIGFRSEVNPYLFVMNRPLFAVDLLGLVTDRADCSCCTDKGRLQELEEANYWLFTNFSRYQFPRGLIKSGESCQDTTIRLHQDLEKNTRPQCWVTSVQLIKLPGADIVKEICGIYFPIHYVVKYEPCDDGGASNNPIFTNDWYFDGFFAKSGLLPEDIQIEDP